MTKFKWRLNKILGKAMMEIMRFRYSALLVFLLFLISACGGGAQLPEESTSTEPVGQYPYQVGLGYGFLGKQVRVSVDGQEVLSMVGTEEIEEYAQLLGTKILGGGSSSHPLVTVQVVVDGGLPYEQVIDLDSGNIIHIYLQETGLEVFNTSTLVLE
jgi:hypothetical protein